MVQIPTKSRAAILVEYSKPLQIREYPIPEVEPGAILVRTEMAGVCGSDVHCWHGRMAVSLRLPSILGHEAIGRIVKLGQGVTKDSAEEPLKVGDRIMWAHIDCGDCYWCRIAHQPNLCSKRRIYGLQCAEEYPHLMGTFSEYIYIVPGTSVVKVPDELHNEEVIGASCAFRTAVAAVERLGNIGIQDNVVIQGAGPVGLYSTLLVREGGAAQVIVVGAPAERLKLAQRFGANHTVSIDEMPDAEKRKQEIVRLTRNIGPDIVVEASGGPTAVPEALEMVRRGGRW